MKQEKSKFELLRSKSIIAILDGDKDFGPLIINGVDSGIKISMPYLSGRKDGSVDCGRRETVLI